MDDSERRLSHLLQQLTHDDDSRLVLLTGREEQHRGLVLEWLIDKRVGHHELHMRPPGDARRDDAVKLDLFNRRVRHRFDVIAVFDDRDRLVRLWRRLGLLTCAVTMPDV